MKNTDKEKLTAKLWLEENKIKVTANYIRDSEKHKYVFRVRCNGVPVVECTPWSEDNYIVCDVTKPGYYTAEVWINIPGTPKAVTEPLFYIPKKIKEEYNDFLKNYHSKNLPDLELYKRVYPFGEIAIIQYAEYISFEGIATDFNHYDVKDENLHIITSLKRHQTNNEEYFFGGITRSKDKLIVGDEDLEKNNVFPTDIDQQIGEFCLFYKIKNGYKLISDYFGFNRFYYYQSEKIFAACNSYHMLIILLKQLGIPLSLNSDKIKASLCEASTIFETNFCFETDINEIACLPIDKCIEFANKKAVIKNTELYDSIRKEEAFNEKEYESLLFEGVEEVKNNLKISLEHNKFDYVRMDLTGGMDSRLLYGAATRLPRSLTDKLRIRTEKKAGNDFEIANTINSIYGFKYDDLSEEQEADISIFDNKLLQSPLSIDMDGYYIGCLQRVPKKINNTLHLTGGAGEIVGKPFMKYFFPNAKTVDDLCNEYSNHIGSVVIYPEGYKIFSEKLKATIKCLPGGTFLKKFENHYLYFRNGFHFKLSYYSDINCIGWTPLQSKSCFKAKNMSWNDSVDLKPQLDFLGLMNTLISQFAYAGEKQNSEKSELKSRLYGHGFPKATVSCNTDTSAFDKATKEKQQNSVFIPNAETVKTSWDKSSKLLISEEAMLISLKELLKFGGKSLQDMGLYLYSWITHTSNHPALAHQRLTLNKRLLILYYQIRLLM